VREHAYFGSMRHRIEAASVDPLAGSRQRLPSPVRREAKGAFVRVAPPSNLAVIRSGQDWSRCAGEELQTYLDDVHPRLIEGMNFLRDHPEETGCCACRFMEERDEEGRTRSGSAGFAMFLSLQHLEAWSKSHPTHLAIFNSFHRMIQRHRNARGLRLWHEVCVLEADNRDFIYVNCHADTGLLRWFPDHGSRRP
jgi:aldoxime dehydratase